MASLHPSRIAQIALPVHDLDRAKHFYGELLGLTHLFDAPPSLAFFQCGETRLMMSRPAGSETAAAPIVYYQVDDLDTAHRQLVAAGVMFESEPHVVARLGDQDLWLAICRDSEGNLLGLMAHR